MMDSPKEAVFWLEKLPPDIWAYIVRYIPGEQLGRLMMTGATLLWQQLKSPNVVKSINLGQDFMSFKSCPRFLKSFQSLEQLYIYSYSEQWSHGIGLTMDSIPSGVRKLEFSGFWDEKDLQKFWQTLKLNEHLPQLEVLESSGVYRPKSANYSWMTHSPQSLTKLSIPRWDGTVELPASLIDFKTTEIELSTSSFVSMLPSSLKSFVVEETLFGVDLIVPLLPSSLHQLSFGKYLEYSSRPRSGSQNLLEQCPKSLLWFKVQNLLEINFETNPMFAALLPSTLTELHIEKSFPDTAWSLLPQQLIKLTIHIPHNIGTVVSRFRDRYGVLRDVKSIRFDALPRSIAKLELLRIFSEPFFCAPPVSNQSYFPPKLTYLRMPQLQLAKKTAKLLPSSLTHLETGDICERVCEHLPSGVRTLIASNILMTPNLIKFLPQSLTVLVSAIPGPQTSWIDCETGTYIEHISKLPEYPKHKKCVANNFNWKNNPPLPPTVTHLNLMSANDIGDSFLQHQHLPHLLELQMSDSTTFSDTSIPFLSRHLTTLALASAKDISGKAFQYLPRCLTSLNLESSESIFDADVQHLPRTLKLAFFANAIHLTESCIPDLPPHLELLRLSHNAHITPSSFPHLPYTLRSSQLYSTVDCASWKTINGVVRQKEAVRKEPLDWATLPDRCLRR